MIGVDPLSYSRCVVGPAFREAVTDMAMDAWVDRGVVRHAEFLDRLSHVACWYVSVISAAFELQVPAFTYRSWAL